MTIEDLEVGCPEAFLHFDHRYRYHQAYHPRSIHPVTFSVSAAPMPSDCEFSFFDPNDPSCQNILFDPNTSVPELFAILRQWVPQVQQSIDVIGNEILKRGCSVNDRDGLTDMTLLHYTCKSGAQGIGDADTAAKFASRLIDLGADISLRSRWTNMNALHYAAYFDVPELIPILLKTSKLKDVDATCSDFEFGTALHIAASNLCLGALRNLLEHGANPAFRDDRGRIPADVVPDPVEMPLEMADAAAVAKEMKQILLDAVPLSCDLSSSDVRSYEDICGSAMLQSTGLKLGDRVLIAGQKVGTLRFCGSTQFASGQWAGIEMDEAEGKNNGSVGGIQYFKCPAKHGIFAPVSKISKALESMKTFIKSSSNRSSVSVKTQKVDFSRVTSKINTGLVSSKRNGACESFFGTDENAKPASAKKAFYIGSSSFSSSSSSNSSYSLETKPPLPRFPRRQDPAKRNLNSAFRSKSSLLRLTNVNLNCPPKRTTYSIAALNLRMAGSQIRPAAETSQEQPEFEPGDRVLVVGRRSGTVRFYGKTNFAPGFWCGIELDKPHGKNDGSVAGVEYFTCPPKHGVFAPPSRVQRITGSLDSLSEISTNKLNYSFPGFRRSYSSTSTNASQKDVDRRLSGGRSKKPVLRRSWSSSATSSAGDGAVKLKKGSQVLLSSSNEMAIIRYMGPTDFAPGLWLGLELRNAKGKHDGSVGDKRYFQCKPNHGVLVRPSRVTYRGINGSKLVDEVC